MSRSPLRASKMDSRKLHMVGAPDGPTDRCVTVPASLRLVTAQVSVARRKTILLAYRNDPARHVLAALLLREGYGVTCCDDGDVALRYLRSAQAELVITGMLMPNMDGLELIRCLRSQHGHLPVIAMAEEADQMSRIYLRYAGIAGAASTHTVPIGRETFLGEIDHILDGGKNAIRNAV
jgi:CheY-like chemotaxis protein